jgi:hypothetical protein
MNMMEGERRKWRRWRKGRGGLDVVEWRGGGEEREEVRGKERGARGDGIRGKGE